METTSLGAAFAAGIGAGIWTEEWVLSKERRGPDRDDGDSCMPPDHEQSFTPKADAGDIEARFARWRKAVQKSLDQDDLVDET